MLIKPALYVAVISSIGLFLFFLCVKKSIARDLRNKLFAVLAYCVAAAFLSPNVIFHQLAAFAIVPLFARRRSEIMPIYIFAFLTLPGISFPLGVGGTYLFVLDSFMSVSLGAAIVALLKKQGNSRGNAVALASILALFFVYFVSSARDSTFTNVMRAFFEQALVIIIPYFIARYAIATIDDVRNMLIGMAAACASLSTLAIYEARKTWPMYRVVYDHYNIVLGGGASVKLRGGFMRSPGPFVESTSFGLWLCFGAFIVLTGRWMFKSKPAHLGACALAIVGLFAPQSRGAWLGLIAAYLIYQAAYGRAQAVIKGVAVVGVMGSLAYFAAMNIPQLASMLQLNSSGTINRDYRQDLLTRGLEVSQNNLLIGTSLPNVMAQLEDMRQGEGIIDFVNTYLYVLLVSGVIGLLAFALAMLAPAWLLFSKGKQLSKFDTQPLAITCALIGSLAVMIAFTALVGRTTMGLGMFLGVSSSLLAMQASQFGRRGMPAEGRSPVEADPAIAPRLADQAT